MSKTYVISWRSRSGPAIGQGKKLMEQAEAERLAKELNEDYPEFMHEAVNTGAESCEAAEALQAVAA